MLDRERFAQVYRSVAVVQLNDAPMRIDDDNERRAGAYVDADLVVDVDAAVVGRKNLNGDVGASGGISTSLALSERRRTFEM